MATTAETHARTGPTTRTTWSRVWPPLTGALVALGSGYGMSDGRGAAVVIAAAGLVYLTAAAAQRRGAAWVAFGATFVVITIAKVTGFDPLTAMLVAAGVVAVVGLVRGAVRPRSGLPLQMAAMAAFGVVAIVAVRADPTVGGLLVAAGLLAHAGWDVHHHRTGRVVSRSLAEFCVVLDTLLAVIVAVVALTA